MTTLTFSATGAQKLNDSGTRSFSRWNIRVTGTFVGSFKPRKTLVGFANATDGTTTSWPTCAYVNEGTGASVDPNTTAITAPGIYSVNGGDWLVAIDCTSYSSGTAVFECEPVAE